MSKGWRDRSDFADGMEPLPMPRDPSTRAPALAGDSCSGFRPTGILQGSTDSPVGLHKRSKRAFAGGPNPGSPGWPARAIVPILAKLAKHLALLASVLIIGGALGKSFSGQIAVFIVIVAATLVRSIARPLP